MTVSGLADVQSRIASIQSRFGGPLIATLPSMPGPAALGVDGGTGQQTFAETLGAAMGAGGTRAAASGAGALGGRSALAPGVAVGTLGAAVGAPAAAPTAAPGSSAGGAAKGARAVALASEHLGVPYVWGGESLAEGGFDCSGLVQHTFKRLGVDLPRVSRDQARAGQPVASLAQARPGDLVAFGSPVDHIGIYAGDNKMVVAPHTGAHVRIQEITRPVVAIRRVV